MLIKFSIFLGGKFLYVALGSEGKSLFSPNPKYFINSSLHLLLNKYPDKYKGVEGGAMEDARKLAARRLEELKENAEVFMSTNPHVYDYSLGRIEPQEDNRAVKPFDEEAYKQKSPARAWQTT